MAINGTGLPYLYRDIYYRAAGMGVETEEYQAINKDTTYINYVDGVEIKFTGHPNNTSGGDGTTLQLYFRVEKHSSGTGSVYGYVAIASEEEVSKMVSQELSLESLQMHRFLIGSSDAPEKYVEVSLSEEDRRKVFSQNASVIVYFTGGYGYTPKIYFAWTDIYGNTPPGFYNVPCEITPPRSKVISPTSGETLNPSLTWDCTIQTGRDDMFGPVALSKYEIQKDVNGSITTIEELLDGTPQDGKYFHLNVGPDFFTEGTTEWRIRFTNTDGLTSDWSEWIVWNTKIGVSSAIPVSPLNIYIDKSERVEFRWLDEVLYGGTVTQADLRYSTNQSSWTTFAELTEWNTDESTGESYRELSTESFPTGTVYWSVRTWVDGTAGNWSAGIPVIIRGAPTAPGLAGITAAPRPMIAWSSQEQAAYEVIVDGLFSTGEVMGKAQAYQILEYYPNGVYTVKIRIKNTAGGWSAYAETQMQIENKTIPAPIATAKAGDTYVKLTVENSESFSKLYVIREGVLIGKMVNGEYTDLTAGGNASRYTVRGVDASDNWSDTEIVVESGLPAGAALSPANAPEDVLWFRNRYGEPFTVGGSYSEIGEFTPVWGRDFPVYQTAGNKNRAVSVAVGTQDGSEAKRLELLCGKTILYRDSMGNRLRGVISSISDTLQKIGGHVYHSIQITVQQVEFDESIQYDAP